LVLEGDASGSSDLGESDFGRLLALFDGSEICGRRLGVIYGGCFDLLLFFGAGQEGNGQK